jgi:glycosyltransferase involved in cell wall biosynthesis
MQELRVLHVIDSLSPGGTEKQCLDLVRGLSSVGVENAVFYFKTGSLLAELTKLGIPVRTLPLGSFPSGWFPFRVIRLACAIRRCAPDVVQTYGFYSNLPGLLAALFAGVPVRIAGRRELGEYPPLAQRRGDRWVWRLSHRVIANSEAVRQRLIGHERVAPGKVVVIRNGIDLRHWPFPDHPMGGNGEAVVGMVAHFREEKDHATFLRAAREILEVVPSARFCLIGSGPLEAVIRECAHRLGITAQLEFLGRLGGQALQAAVRQFRVSVLTSKSEGLPNVVLESMAAGRPVIATAVGGIPELIEDGVTGFLVPPEDPMSLAERIVCLLKEPSLARSMGERGRQKVEGEFTIERMVGQFHGLYRDLLGERRGRGR